MVRAADMKELLDTQIRSHIDGIVAAMKRAGEAEVAASAEGLAGATLEFILSESVVKKLAAFGATDVRVFKVPSVLFVFLLAIDSGSVSAPWIQVPKGVLPLAATALNAILKPHARMLLGNMGTQHALHMLFDAWAKSAAGDPKRPSRDQYAFASLVLTVLLGINDDPSLLSVYYGSHSSSLVPPNRQQPTSGPWFLGLAPIMIVMW